jgi:hypothetical protein
MPQTRSKPCESPAEQPESLADRQPEEKCRTNLHACGGMRYLLREVATLNVDRLGQWDRGLEKKTT